MPRISDPYASSIGSLCLEHRISMPRISDLHALNIRSLPRTSDIHASKIEFLYLEYTYINTNKKVRQSIKSTIHKCVLNAIAALNPTPMSKLGIYIYIYIYVYIYSPHIHIHNVCICIYIYIYIHISLSLSLSLYIYIY